MPSAAQRSPSVSSVLAWLPQGSGLEEDTWRDRHQGICVVLWVHVVGLTIIGFLRGEAPLHALLDSAVVAWLAVGAEIRRFGIPLRSALATAGLLASSAVLVHLFDGLIELHFHFFVMVALAALYQAWTPFLLSLVFVVAHHGIAGSLAPHEVYNHPAAANRPLLWGLIHGGFIVAESAACLVYWRAAESAVRRERSAKLAAQQSHRDLADAQHLSGVGSWEWDRGHDIVSWSEQMYALTMVGPDETPSVALFLELVHPEDRARVTQLIAEAAELGTDIDYECRLLRRDGSIRWIHTRGATAVAPEGHVTSMSGACHDVTERKELQDAVTHLAFHDPLTDLANRRLFLKRIDEDLADRRASKASVAVLYIDLDGFKPVNDEHGHAVGDALLRQVASRLQAATRRGDLVGRLGGDEFAVLCPGADRAAAMECVRRIEASMARPFEVDGRRVPISASIGVAVAEDGDTAATLLFRADAEMYGHKTRTRRPTHDYDGRRHTHDSTAIGASGTPETPSTP